ncbi:MAG: Phosphoglycolate phosphatase [Firmicutes bacterium ADurb.Bin300]|nr:MAG: Phosphoglycolate phosphatase [Firmicutes bacterium ADurb.Bin300]
MKYKAVIFDMDGTLLDTLDDLADSTNFALGSMGFPQRTKAEIKAFVGNGVERLISLSVPRSISKEDKQKCIEIFKAHYAENSRNKTKPYEGILELLKLLKKKKIKTGVVSNKYQPALIKLCTEFFEELIDFAVGEKAGVPKKPSPECVYECMEKLGCEKQQTLFIGDSDIDVLTAKNAGLCCVGVLWGFRDENLLKTAGAEYIVKSPLEIVDIIINSSCSYRTEGLYEGTYDKREST